MLLSQAMIAQLLFSFVVVCISASGTNNLTISDVLECGTNSHTSNMSNTWSGNYTESCLYVTILDQFGDGWANNSNLFFWAQMGDQDSNIVSVGLDCTEDCGAVKSGCIPPLHLEGEDEHFLHFTLVSLNHENHMSVPDYFWEMQWSVQIVKGDEWREKYYGGFNSSMVFNYNPEADDLTLAWSENLWQYPPSLPTSCTTPAFPRMTSSRWCTATRTLLNRLSTTASLLQMTHISSNLLTRL